MTSQERWQRYRDRDQLHSNLASQTFFSRYFYPRAIRPLGYPLPDGPAITRGDIHSLLDALQLALAAASCGDEQAMHDALWRIMRRPDWPAVASTNIIRGQVAAVRVGASTGPIPYAGLIADAIICAECLGLSRAARLYATDRIGRDPETNRGLTVSLLGAAAALVAFAIPDE